MNSFPFRFELLVVLRFGCVKRYYLVSFIGRYVIVSKNLWMTSMMRNILKGKVLL